MNFHLSPFERLLRAFQRRVQKKKKAAFNRRVAFGDLITDRWENARAYGFGEGTSMYDNVLVIGDVRIGRDVWIGPNVVLDGSGGGITIGDNCSISAGVQVYTHHTVKWATSGGEDSAERAPTRIGNRVYIGPNSVIQMGAEIGDGAIIGAMSLVKGRIPPDTRAWGCPARIISPTD